MAKLKADWLKEAQELGLEVTSKNTVAEIKAAVEAADNPSEDASAEPADNQESFAKAGKRSKKGLEEAEEKAEKIARQQGEASDDDEDASEEPEKKKGPKPKIRPHIERKSKRFQAAAEKVEKGKEYSLEDGMKLAQDTSTVKFDASVEIHIRLNVDPKQADQNVRGSVVLPHGTGRTVRVAVLADEDNIKAAKDAGADVANNEELFEKLEKQSEEFDILVAQPEMMSKLGKYAKYLGPKGMMPSPKSGTVTNDIARTVRELKAGRVEYRVDKYGIIHVGIGKVSFDTKQLIENAQTLIGTLRENRPASVKSEFVNSLMLSSSMGPSITIDTTTGRQ